MDQEEVIYYSYESTMTSDAPDEVKHIPFQKNNSVLKKSDPKIDKMLDDGFYENAYHGFEPPSFDHINYSFGETFGYEMFLAPAAGNESSTLPELDLGESLKANQTASGENILIISNDITAKALNNIPSPTALEKTKEIISEILLDVSVKAEDNSDDGYESSDDNYANALDRINQINQKKEEIVKNRMINVFVIDDSILHTKFVRRVVAGDMGSDTWNITSTICCEKALEVFESSNQVIKYNN